MKPTNYPVIVQTEQLHSNRPIYLDNQATTPVDPRVIEIMHPYFTQEFGNPHSDSHLYGWEANKALEKSRRLVAHLIGADSREIIFTSGATESCNIAIRGMAYKQKTSKRKKIITLVTEHSCVLETSKALQKEGFQSLTLPVQKDGQLDLNLLREVVDNKTLLVSVMLGNNEIGVIQPLQEIVEICRKAGAYSHTDATQAVGKIPVNVRELQVDFLSFSAHKYYGPKGIGGLYIRWGCAATLQPLMTGGGQERGIRPGTVPLSLSVGFGEASRIVDNDFERDRAHITHLAHKLYATLKKNIPKIRLFGHPEKRLPGSLNIAFPYLSGEQIIERVGSQLALSTGSACSSIESKPSHVLQALGLTDEEANSGVRISIGRFNTEEEIREAAKVLIEAASN